MGKLQKSKQEQAITRNHELERRRNLIRKRLISPQGVEKRKRRSAEVEPVFSPIKSNRNGKRFIHKDTEKAEFEFELYTLT